MLHHDLCLVQEALDAPQWRWRGAEGWHDHNSQWSASPGRYGSARHSRIRGSNGSLPARSADSGL